MIMIMIIILLLLLLLLLLLSLLLVSISISSLVLVLWLLFRHFYCVCVCKKKREMGIKPLYSHWYHFIMQSDIPIIHRNMIMNCHQRPFLIINTKTLFLAFLTQNRDFIEDATF